MVSLNNFKNEKIRHVGRNQYNNVSMDALLKFFYRYNFHRLCLVFKCKDSETGDIHSFNSIIEVAIWLHNSSEGYNGIPIVAEGVKTYHSDNENEPYFFTTIELDYKQETITNLKGNIEVYSIKK